jgi:hypothetical protein
MPAGAVQILKLDKEELIMNLLGLITAVFGMDHKSAPKKGRFVSRRFTQDVAIPFRMGAGAPGDVNRTHPASIPPFLVDPTNPPTAFGMPAVINPASGGLRGILATDGALTDIDAIVVRPYPIQQQTATNYGAQAFGTGVPPTSQPVDGLVSGYIMVQVPAGQQPTKKGTVYIWIGAAGGGHVVGGFEAVNGAGNTIAIASDKTYFNSPADANGVAEIAFNI